MLCQVVDSIRVFKTKVNAIKLYRLRFVGYNYCIGRNYEISLVNGFSWPLSEVIIIGTGTGECSPPLSGQNKYRKLTLQELLRKKFLIKFLALS